MLFPSVRTFCDSKNATCLVPNCGGRVHECGTSPTLPRGSGDYNEEPPLVRKPAAQWDSVNAPIPKYHRGFQNHPNRHSEIPKYGPSHFSAVVRDVFSAGSPARRFNQPVVARVSSQTNFPRTGEPAIVDDMPDVSSPAEGSTPTDRARDAQGRAHNDRPRDGLGRPLAPGSTGVPRQPEGISRTPAETLAVAQSLLDTHKPFHAHDVFEDHWKQTTGPERNLWRALAQLAVGVTHAARGNVRGAIAVLDRAAANLDAYADHPPHQVAVSDLCAWARHNSTNLDPESTTATWLDVPRVSRR